MKAMDEPYVNLSLSGPRYRLCSWIKLKKDYINGLGDLIDMAVLGASYDAEEAARLKVKIQDTICSLDSLPCRLSFQ